jgi:hypothetical protein
LTVLYPMFAVSLVSFAVAAAAGMYGFGAVSDEAPLAAKLYSALFLLLALASFWWAWMGRAIRKSPPRFTECGRSRRGGTHLARHRRALPS